MSGIDFKIISHNLINVVTAGTKESILARVTSGKLPLKFNLHKRLKTMNTSITSFCTVQINLGTTTPLKLVPQSPPFHPPKYNENPALESDTVWKILKSISCNQQTQGWALMHDACRLITTPTMPQWRVGVA